MLVSGFSGVINVSTDISDLAGYTVRIARFTEVAAELKDKILTLGYAHIYSRAISICFLVARLLLLNLPKVQMGLEGVITLGTPFVLIMLLAIHQPESD